MQQSTSQRFLRVLQMMKETNALEHSEVTYTGCIYLFNFCQVYELLSWPDRLLLFITPGSFNMNRQVERTHSFLTLFLQQDFVHQQILEEALTKS